MSLLVPRASAFALLIHAALSACDGDQQGYFTPCDEPVGLAAGCEPEGGESELTPGDACLKLATCGVIDVTSQPPEDAGEDWTDPFDLCVMAVQMSLGDDPGTVVLACINAATCPDLAATYVGDEVDPEEDVFDGVEAVLGWCGRGDPQ